MKRTLHLLLISIVAVLCPALSAYAVVFESTHYTTYNGLAANTVRYVMQDSEGYIWFSTNNGLSRYDGYTFRYYGKEEGLTEPRLFYTAEEPDGSILIASVSREVFRLNKKTDSISRVQEDVMPKLVRIAPDLSKRGREWVDSLMCANGIVGRYYSVADKRGNTWFAAYDYGVSVLDNTTGRAQHYSYAKGDREVLSSDNIMSLACDRTGCIWIGYEFYGISRLQTLDDSWYTFYHFGELKHDDFRLLYEDGGDLLAGNRDGNVGRFKVGVTRASTLSDYALQAPAYSATRAHDGRLWFGTRGAGMAWARGAGAAGTYRYFRHDAEDSLSIASDHIYSICEDDKGRMWIAAFEGGLDMMEEEGVFRHFFQETYGTQRVRGIRKDSNGRLWVGSSDGVMVFDPDSLLEDDRAYITLNTDNGKLTSNEVRSLYISSAGRVYIAEDGEGFAEVDVPTDGNYRRLEPLHFGLETGLTNTMVQAFAEDRDGNIWISTELGINVFNPSTEQLVGYYPGLTTHSNVFNEDAAVALSDGHIVFGSTSGILVVDPSRRPKNAVRPEVKMVDLDIDQLGTIHAAFSTFGYNSRIPDLFSFRLKGYDEDWSEPSKDNTATYRRIRPGSHELHVRALAENGGWSEDTEFTIEIPTPWYLSWWFVTLLAIIILGPLGYVVHAIYTRARLHEQMRLTEQLNEAKLVFFTNVSHEFRTPLTLIRGAIDRISHTENLPAQLAPQVKMLQRNSDRLMRLINQLLEFRRMQNKVMSLRLEKLDVVLQLRELFSSFKDLAESKDIRFTFESDKDALTAYIDRSNVDKVLYNLLSNAIKYTPDGGEIRLSVKVYGDPQEKLIIRVIDTGVGVPPEQRATLFDQRFTRSRFLSGTGSMGIGLNLTAALVEVHHGSITYEPNVPTGSVFTVTLPLSTESYSEEDFLQDKDNPLALHREEEAEKPLPELTVPLNSQEILLVEDNDDMRGYVAEELSRYFIVDTAASGEEAIEKTGEKEYALVVTDVMMQGMSGFDLAHKLKSDFATSHIPLVALTALDSTESKIQGTEIGLDAYVTKPFSPRLLLATIINLINSRAKMRERFSKDLSSVEPLATGNGKDREFLDKFNALIDAELQNSDIQADDFAAKMLLGRTVFFKKVKGLTGYSPKEYLRIQRMKKAVELFRSGEYNVSEVTYEVGMTDPFYFSRCFKQQFGIPPTAFIKQLRGENVGPEEDEERENDTDEQT